MNAEALRLQAALLAAIQERMLGATETAIEYDHAAAEALVVIEDVSAHYPGDAQAAYLFGIALELLNELPTPQRWKVFQEAFFARARR